MRQVVVLGVAAVLQAAPVAAQTPTALLPIEFERSAEFGWMKKKVLERRVLDDLTDAKTWVFTGTGALSFRAARPSVDAAVLSSRILRVELQMFTDSPAPTRNRLSSVNLRRVVAGEDWSGYNRLAMWIRPDVSGLPMFPLQIVLHNDGAVKIPDAYYREGIHYVTLRNNQWQQVLWEIEPLARDRVTMIELGYWMNKMLAAASDHVGFEIGRVELQRVEPDHYEGWSVAPGRISFSHTGYPLTSSKTALASGLTASAFQLIRVDNAFQPEVMFAAPVRTVTTRLGTFQQLDFSALRQPGRYVIQAGDVSTRAFSIDGNVWRGTILKALNFFYGERCGFLVPGSHDVDHRDWFATLGDKRIALNGGWHDAGDLSQGVVNTGEAVYAMFALAERLQQRGDDAELLQRLLDEAKWGLDWVLRVRFEGGYRIGFASHNLWTNGIVGDADDRTREALNNPNYNYIAAAAGAIAARVLKQSDPELAARSLLIAEDDWRHAIAGKEGPETWATPAFGATLIELAGIGILASLELYQATGRQQYADKAFELAQVIVGSQQKTYVGRELKFAGFFYNGPDRQSIFHQFHRGNDQAPIVALARLVETFPEHRDWMKWYATVAMYAEYQKATSQITAPYDVLPAYVYHEREHLEVPEQGALHMATREAFLAQVRRGWPMGDGYYLKAFPVWFARRGNYGVLLSQAKALSTAAHLRGDRAAAELAQLQLQWIVGRNPFVQSTMYGEGYDWAQQYSVSSGDFVGALPVGMQTRGNDDAPYWPAQNMYVYKEVWVHPVSRWLWLMQDLAGPALVQGMAQPGSSVAFTDSASVDSTRVAVGADGRFRTFLPHARYTARAGSEQVSLTTLPGATYSLDLRPGAALDFDVTTSTAANGQVTIRLRATGRGAHTFAVRAENLIVDQSSRSVTLVAGRQVTLEWRARVRAADAPWVAVIVPDGDVTRRQEAFGG